MAHLSELLFALMGIDFVPLALSSTRHSVQLLSQVQCSRTCEYSRNATRLKSFFIGLEWIVKNKSLLKACRVSI
jgi:hypothetical protein